MSFLLCLAGKKKVDSEARAYAHLHPIGRGRDLAKPTSTRRPATYDPDFLHGRSKPLPYG